MSYQRCVMQAGDALEVRSARFGQPPNAVTQVCCFTNPLRPPLAATSAGEDLWVPTSLSESGFCEPIENDVGVAQESFGGETGGKDVVW